jgi:hypothetical protein
VKILAAAIGNCVHVAGVQAFLEIARGQGHMTMFLGPAVPLRRLMDGIREESPGIVAVSYRLSPGSAKALLDELKSAVDADPDLRKPRYFFGGTPPAAKVASDTGLFDAVFDGSEPHEAIVAALRGGTATKTHVVPGADLVTRVDAAFPVPLVRHHFGLPDMKETVLGARKIAESRTVDVLSIAPDQNAQESFFRPQEMAVKLNGAGGAPIRSPDDLKAIREATRTGNHPLLRCYSGTRDLVKWADMLKETIDIAWGAVPLMWYSELDGRSKRPLKEAIAENQGAIRHYADKGAPVEVNESHQWALRRCGDTVELATAYIAAHNARALGVRTYVCQFMFDTPRGVSPSMDIAKMMAKLELVESLSNGDFRVLRMVRSGLASLSTAQATAKGQMAASVYSAMALRPHIVHVVGFSEADHVATADEVIESCAIARGAVHRALLGVPDPLSDPAVAERKAHLLKEARLLIDAVKRSGHRKTEDPLTDPETLHWAVKDGLLDAPDLIGGGVAKGRMATAIVNGACVAIDCATGAPLPESERIKALGVTEKDLDMVEI